MSFIVLSERVLLHFPDFLLNCLALPAWRPGSLGGFTQILVRGVCAPTPPPQMSNSAVRSSNTLLSALFANRLHILRDGSGGQAEIIIRVHIHPGSHLLPTSLYPQGFLCLPSPSFSANLSIVPHNFLFTGQRLTCRRESLLEFIIVFSSERGAYQVMVAPIAFIFIYAKTANEKIRGSSCR